MFVDERSGISWVYVLDEIGINMIMIYVDAVIVIIIK